MSSIVYIENIEQYYETPINLPRYKCYCNRSPNLIYRHNCSICNNKGTLSYEKAVEVWGVTPALDMQIPQCHICTRFETKDNLLFAYSYLERDGEFKFIYRCRKGHDHDHGMVLIDIRAGSEVCL